MHNITRYAVALFAAFSFAQGIAQADTPPAATASTGTEPRVALVIGNANYTAEMKLANPANDATLVAATLKKLGFDVTLLTDSGQKAMEHAIIDFGDRLSKAGPDATGLFYYAGHGLQVDGDNYLVPVDAAIAREADVDIDAVQADLVLKQMAYAGSRVNIVILDSCRNDPLEHDFRSVASADGQGFGEIRSKPKGTFISYSTAPGEVAIDGSDGHSPFAEALVAAMQEPGLDLPEVFQHVREKVLDATDQKQTPWDSSSLVKSFYFIPPQQTQNAIAAATPAAQPAATQQLASTATPAASDANLVRTATATPSAATETHNAPQPNVATDTKTADTDVEPGFVAIDRTLFARSGSRLRKAPDGKANAVATLRLNTQLYAIARSNDGAWWQVATDDGRTGYISRQAVADSRIASAAPAPKAKVTLASYTPAAVHATPATLHANNLTGIALVDQAVSWLASAANTGTTAVPTTRSQH